MATYPCLLAASGLKALDASSLAFGWFDGLVIVVLILGVLRGRQRGMSAELLDFIMWIVIVVAGGLLYGMLGGVIASVTKLQLLYSNIAAYLLIAILVGMCFTFLKHGVGEKLTGSDAFGSLEYYLGMCAGMVRFFCVLLAFMAVLNARLYTAEEMRGQVKYQEKEFGKVYFPTVGMIQQDVFQKSMVGQAVKEHLSMVLVSPASPQATKESIGKRRERDVNEALGIK